MIRHKHTLYAYRVAKHELDWYTFTVTNLDTHKDIFTSIVDYESEQLAKEHAAMFIDYFCKQ